jgi:hypothetical protein
LLEHIKYLTQEDDIAANMDPRYSTVSSIPQTEYSSSGEDELPEYSHLNPAEVTLGRLTTHATDVGGIAHHFFFIFP